MPNSTAEFWAGPAGNEYTARNRVIWQRRIPFWAGVIDRFGIRSVYEVGCNAGWNLSAIRRAHPDVTIAGHDINSAAVYEAQCAGLDAVVSKEFSSKPVADLVFTAGVLIHVAPTELNAMMQRIIAASFQYVLAVEYAADVKTEIEYRGQRGLLWKRPFGKLYEALGLKLVDEWDAGPGFDNCTAWLLSKD